jgi:hypothetical protein
MLKKYFVQIWFGSLRDTSDKKYKALPNQLKFFG